MNADLSPTWPSHVAFAERQLVSPREKQKAANASQDIELLALVRADDQEKTIKWIDAWFGENKTRLYELASYELSRSGLSSKAEDATVDTMVKVLNNVKTFRGDSSFATWVDVILKHLCCDVVRKAIREQRALELFGAFGEQLLGTEDGLVATAEQEAQLQYVLNQLKGKDKAVLTLFFMDGLSESEVAKKVGSTIDSVASRKRRTLLKLRGLLKRNGGGI